LEHIDERQYGGLLAPVFDLNSDTEVVLKFKPAPSPKPQILFLFWAMRLPAININKKKKNLIIIISTSSNQRQFLNKYHLQIMIFYWDFSQERSIYLFRKLIKF
jgi:hypothetical protein